MHRHSRTTLRHCKIVESTRTSPATDDANPPPILQADAALRYTPVVILSAVGSESRPEPFTEFYAMQLFTTTALVAGTGLVVLTLATRTRRVQRLDDLLEEKAAPHRRRLRRGAAAATLTGEKFVHPVIAAVTASTLFLARTGPVPRFVLPLASASLGGIVAHHLIKFVYHRPRPEVALRRDKTEGAFPSGHTTNATAVVMTSAYMLVREGLVPSPVAIVCVVVLCVGTGLSRVALGWHWGTDVVGGWMAGTVVASLACWWFDILNVVSR